MGSPGLRDADGWLPRERRFPTGDLAGQIDLLLYSGGGESRLPGVPRHDLTSAESEIWFSSTSISRPGRHARAAILESLAGLSGALGDPAPVSLWFNALRARIANALGAPSATVLLAPSLAEGRALAHFVAATTLGRAVVEMVPSPEESDDDALSLPNWARETIALRGADGTPLDPLDIDAHARSLASDLLNDGQALLLHALDVSRTGLAGVSRAAARRIVDAAPERVLTLLDAGELRTPPERLAADLAEGMMVLASGSRFMGGPAHCAALLLPPAIARALEAAPSRFAADISPARFDLPAGLRHVFGGGFDTRMNVGLGLRWAGALAEFERYNAIPQDIRDRVLDAFSRRARAMAARLDFLDLEPRRGHADDFLRGGVVSLHPVDPGGGRMGYIGASALRAALGLPRPGVAGDAVCHIGAPVPTAAGAILPLSISAPLICDVAGRLARGVAFDRAMAPVWRDLSTLFTKWETLAG